MIGISVAGARLTKHCKRSFANDFAKTQLGLNAQSLVVQSMHTVNRLIWALAQLAEIDEKRAILFKKLDPKAATHFAFEISFKNYTLLLERVYKSPNFFRQMLK